MQPFMQHIIFSFRLALVGSPFLVIVCHSEKYFILFGAEHWFVFKQRLPLLNDYTFKQQ